MFASFQEFFNCLYCKIEFDLTTCQRKLDIAQGSKLELVAFAFGLAPWWSVMAEAREAVNAATSATAEAAVQLLVERFDIEPYSDFSAK